MNQKRIEDAVALAQEAFWAKVAECFPEAQSGDLDPGAQTRLDRELSTAVAAWVDSNVPPQSKQLRTEAVFADAPEPHGSLWRNLCSQENELATMLLAKPGFMVVIDSDAWILRERGDELVLCHANCLYWTLSEEASRFDFDLGWVDLEPEELASYNELLGRAIDEFDDHIVNVDSLIAEVDPLAERPRD